MRVRPHHWRAVPLVAVGLWCLGCEPDPPAEVGCLSCHLGIEQAHGPIPEDECVVCHGGDAQVATKEAAHVPVPDNWAEVRGSGLPPAPHGFIRDFAPDQLDQLDPAYVKFINPSDIRVVDETCGVCHPNQAATMPTSIMVTNAGHYFPTLFLAGIQEDRLAHVGSYEATDPDCDPSIPGTVCSLETLQPADAEAITEVIASGDQAAIETLAYGHYLAKNCNTCHQAGYPRNNSPALYRSSGCASCHMVYDQLGIYEGGDPTIPKGSPVHPRLHEITTAIPTEQCATCHFQGGRIGLAFRGIREGGFGSADTPPNAEPIQDTLYGHSPGYYFTDEDTTNDVDETPPDLHYAAGMHCVDCHVGSDVHGTGRLFSTSKQQVDLSCEDCHGTVREAIEPDAEGVFRTESGRPLPQLSQRDDGTVVLTGKVDGAEHPVAQVADILASNGASAAMHAAMGTDDGGWSHTDSLTCDSCHTAWSQQCVGCHVTFDLRLDQVDYQTGLSSPGLTRGSRATFSITDVLLGTAPDGRIQNVVASQQVQMSVVGSSAYGSGEGEVLLGEEVSDGEGGTEVLGEFRHRDGLAANNGFAPFFSHTTTASPRGCDTCHRTNDSDEEMARVRGVYGFGTGEFMLAAPSADPVDGLQFLDANGDPLTTWVHEGTGPAAPDVLQRALDVIVEP